MQELPKTPFTFQQFVKYPVYAICFLLITYFIYKEFVESNGCQTENEYLRKELVQVRSEKDQLTTALLIKNGIIFKQAEEAKEKDSTIREKLGVKAKKIIEGN